MKYESVFVEVEELTLAHNLKTACWISGIKTRVDKIGGGLYRLTVIGGSYTADIFNPIPFEEFFIAGVGSTLGSDRVLIEGFDGSDIFTKIGGVSISPDKSKSIVSGWGHCFACLHFRNENSWLLAGFYAHI